MNGIPPHLEFADPVSGPPAMSGNLRALAGELAAPDFGGSPGWTAGLATASTVGALGTLLNRHASEVLCTREWPVIVEAWRLARLGHVRELLELDATWGREIGAAGFAQASFRVGQRQLSKLRGLRHERVIQRYLDAVEAGRAHAWHPVVYGVVLAVYHLPLRQGLLHFATQILAGLVTAAERSHRLPAEECQALLDVTCASLPHRLPPLSPG